MNQLLQRWAAGLCLALLPSLAFAQGTPVYQSGAMGAPHNVAKITRNGQIQDGGGMQGDSQGRGVNPFRVLDKFGLGLCSDTAATSGNYSAFCFGHDASGNAVLSLINYGLANTSLNIQSADGLNLTASGNLGLSAGGATIGTGTASGLALAGTPTAPTPTGGDNSTKLATTAYVNTFVGASGAAPIPFAATNAAVAALAQATTTRVMRLGVTAQGDAPPVVFVGQTGNCAANSLVNDVGSCVNGADGNSWKASFVGQINAAQFGINPASVGFHTITTVAANCSITDATGGWSSANIGELIDIAGAGSNELHLITSITAVADATHFTTAACPTLAMSARPVIVHHGVDNTTALNNAAAAAKARKMGLKIPAGEYLVSGPIQCNVVDYNNYNLPNPGCTGEPGSIIKAMASMSGSVPVANTLFTIGGYANGSDYSQYIRKGRFDGGGLTLDCSFICNYAFGLPFSLDSGFQNFLGKNAIVAAFHVGATGAPATTGGIFINHVNVERDIHYLTISNITSANPPVVTTTSDHGVTTGRVVTVIGANNVPSPGPISFIAESTGARTLKLHDIDGSGWAAFAGTASLALTFPTNVLAAPVFGVTTANPAKISTQGDLNLVNGQTWCVYGLGGTGANGTTAPPTNVPDGCYVISNVNAPGGDGPYEFTVPVNSTGFTFTGGGITFRKNTIADMGFYLDNVSDVQISDSIITGTRWPIYTNSANSGYNGKYSHNHSYNQPEHGWITAAHVLGGSNSLIGEQVDTPVIFGAQFIATGNSSTGFGLNAAFPYMCDGCSTAFRLDSGAVAAASLTAVGTNINGYSGSIRANTLSNNLTAGNSAYYGSISNYIQHGFGNAGNMLYTMPDSTQAKPVFTGNPSNPVGTISSTLVAMGLGLSGCTITPRYSGIVDFEIYGSGYNATAGDGTFTQLYAGTGTAPANGAAFGGGTLGIGNVVPAVEIEPATGGQFAFKVGGVANPALALNVPVWFDLGVKARVGGAGHTAVVNNLTCNAREQ